MVLGAALQSAAGSGAASSGTVGTPNNAVVVGNTYHEQGSGATRTTTWSGLTENVDDEIEGGSTFSTASGLITAASVTATATPSGSTANEVFTLASFGSSAYGINGYYLDFADADNLGLDANVAVSTTTYRYLKLNVTGVAGSTTYVSVGELEYYVDGTKYPSSTMTGNSAPSPLVASASEDTGTGAELAFKAFDNNINTHWQTAIGTVTGWVKIDLGSGNEIAVNKIGIGTAETPDRTPSTFTIQGSNNDSDYTTLATYSSVFTSAPTARVKFYLPVSTGNNWLAKGSGFGGTGGFDLTNGSNQFYDTPTRNFAILDPGRSVGTISVGNLKHTSPGSAVGWGVTQQAMGLPSGKW